MKISSKKTPSSVVITATFDTNDFEPARLKALSRLAKNLKIPGFRNGHAPANVVERHVDSNMLNNETLNILIQTNLPKMFDQAKLRPLSMPDVQVIKFVPGESAELEVKADIMPTVKLGDYKNLQVVAPKTTIKAAQVDEVLDRIAASMAESKLVQRPAKKDDEVIIDFVGKKDGVAFEGGSAKDYKLVLGSGSFIPGFEEGLIGHAAGDKVTLKLKFPADYGVADLAGKATEFEVLVKQVNARTKPEIDDDLAKKTGAAANLKDLKADIKKNLSQEAQYRDLEKYKDKLLIELTKQSKTTAPASIVEEQFHNIKQELESNLKTSSISFDDYLKSIKKSQSEWEKEAKKQAEQRVLSSLVLNALADELNIKVPESEFTEKVAAMQHAYKNNPEIAKQLASPDVQSNIRHRIRMDKTLDALAQLNRK